jgi:hypothetical protein
MSSDSCDSRAPEGRRRERIATELLRIGTGLPRGCYNACEEEAAQVERLRYVLAHGCKEGLVERLRDWPGVSAVRALLEDESLEGLWFDRTREHVSRRRGTGQHFMAAHGYTPGTAFSRASRQAQQ